MTRVPRRLQLGAFDQVPEGWLNTDVTPHLFVARVPGLPWLLCRLGVIGPERYAAHRSGAFRRLSYLDVTRPFRFDDDTLRGRVRLSSPRASRPRRCRAVPRGDTSHSPSGRVLRLAVPDLDEVVAQYDATDPDGFLAGLYDAHSGRRSSSSRHRWMYNARSLEALLRRVGFREVERCEYRQGRCPDVAKIETRQWSLFMEGVK